MPKMNKAHIIISNCIINYELVNRIKNLKVIRSYRRTYNQNKSVFGLFLITC